MNNVGNPVPHRDDECGSDGCGGHIVLILIGFTTFFGGIGLCLYEIYRLI